VAHRLVAAALLLVACGEPASPADAGVDAKLDGATAQCAAGLKPNGPACVPIFDHCADDEVPLLGGGCKKVGVEECTPASGGRGIKGPPDWTCTSIGPPTTCLPGWLQTTDGCAPILPAAACGSGTMEVIGESACQAVGDCGHGTWGDLKTDATTIFVDGNHAGSGDGSAEKPYATIGAALATATAGARIAVAAGTYNEDLVLDEPLVLEGRCTSMVTINGTPAAAHAAVEVSPSGTAVGGFELRGLTITGPRGGLWIEKAKVALQAVAVDGCGEIGVTATRATIDLRRVLLAKNHAAGISLSHGVATLDRVVAKDSLPRASDGKWGVGVAADRRSTLTVRDSVFSGNRFLAVGVVSSDASLTRVVVRDTGVFAMWSADESWNGPPDGPAKASSLVVADSLVWGIQLAAATARIERTVVSASPLIFSGGIAAFSQYVPQVGASRVPEVVPSSVTIRDCRVAHVKGVGVMIRSSAGTIERTVIEATEPYVTDDGYGVVAENGGDEASSSLVLRDSLVADNESGVVVSGSNASIDRTVVRDSQAVGVVSARGAIAVRDSLLAHNQGNGLLVIGAAATVERTVIRDTEPNALALGDGIITASGEPACASCERSRASLTLRESLLLRNRYTGVGVICATAVIERSAIRDTQFPPSADGTAGIAVYQGEGCSSAEARLSETVIEKSRGAGLLVLFSASVHMERSAVHDTLRAGPYGWGDGIQVASVVPGWLAPHTTGPTRLELHDSLVEGSARVGLIFYGAEGSVQRSTFRRGALAIDLEESAMPEIVDNVYEGNVFDGVSFGNRFASVPPPKLPETDW
jgi:hypothetical protein